MVALLIYGFDVRMYIYFIFQSQLCLIAVYIDTFHGNADVKQNANWCALLLNIHSVTPQGSQVVIPLQVQLTVDDQWLRVKITCPLIKRHSNRTRLIPTREWGQLRNVNKLCDSHVCEICARILHLTDAVVLFSTLNMWPLSSITSKLWYRGSPTSGLWPPKHFQWGLLQTRMLLRCSWFRLLLQAQWYDWDWLHDKTVLPTFLAKYKLCADAPPSACSLDGYFVFSVKATDTDPPIDPSSLMVKDQPQCFPVVSTSDTAIFKIGIMDCGTKMKVTPIEELDTGRVGGGNLWSTV